MPASSAALRPKVDGSDAMIIEADEVGSTTRAGDNEQVRHPKEVADGMEVEKYSKSAVLKRAAGGSTHRT